MTLSAVARRGNEVGRALALALHGLRLVMGGAVILLFVYMVGAIVTQVIGRYVFNFSIAAAEETATFAQIWMVLFGAGVAMRRNQHVGIDILIALCPKPVQRAVVLAATLIGLWFLWVVFINSFPLIEVGKLQRSPALQWPMDVTYMALPIGAAYFALEFLLAMIPRCLGRAPAAPQRDLADEQ
jgi:TRAP-type transport system small permease protein